MNMKFVLGFAAESAVLANAGTIASRNGKATAAPIPFSNVRRGKYFFVIIMASLLLSKPLLRCLRYPIGGICCPHIHCHICFPGGAFLLNFHLEWPALDDAL